MWGVTAASATMASRGTATSVFPISRLLRDVLRLTHTSLGRQEAQSWEVSSAPQSTRLEVAWCGGLRAS